MIAQGGISDGLIASGYAGPTPDRKSPLSPGFVVYSDREFREGNYIVADLDVILTPGEVLPLTTLETTGNLRYIPLEADPVSRQRDPPEQEAEDGRERQDGTGDAMGGTSPHDRISSDGVRR